MSSFNGVIVKNTVFLYIRLLITVFITIFSSRFVLQTLGAEDYGLYNVVGGVVVMFGFLNAGMVQASQRFMSFELGRGNKDILYKLFSTTMLIHILIAVVIFVLVEIVGVWYVNSVHFVIQPGRLDAANWVLQCSLISFVFMILCVPFNACVISHEKMGIYSIISILDSVLKLLIIFVVQVAPFDKLIFYSVLLVLISLLNLAIYYLLCKKYFPDYSFRPKYDASLFIRVLGFASWSFVGNIGFSLRGQGVNMVINSFFGTLINASRGLAYQVSSQVSAFVSNFQMAFTPQITKRYAAKEIDSMLDLVFKGSKYSLFLLSFIAIPVIVDAPYIMDLWLGKGHVPQYTIEFLRLSFVASMLDSMAFPLGKAIDATGNIKWFQISVAIVMLLDIPLSYLLLSCGVLPYQVIFAAILVSCMGIGVRLFFVKKRFKSVSVWRFLWQVFLRCITICFASYVISQYIMNRFINDTFIGLIEICIVCSVVTALLLFLFGLEKGERQLVIRKTHSLFIRLRNIFDAYYRSFSGKGFIKSEFQFDIIGNGDKDTFFGYYDISPFNPCSQDFIFIELNNDKTASIIVQDLSTGNQRKVATTHAWNWQQGCRLRWLPNDRECLIFNDYVDGNYCARIINVRTNEERFFPYPLYDIANDGSIGATLNFERLGVKRPGYGYTVREYIPSENLSEESISLIDMKSGRIVKQLSYKSIAHAANKDDINFSSYYLNHLSFSPSGNRLMFFYLDGRTRRTEAFMLVYDIKEEKIFPLELHHKVSHYVWEDESSIIATVYNDEGECNYFRYTIGDNAKMLFPEILNKDGHPVLLNEREVVTDTYPDKRCYQHLFVFDKTNGEIKSIADIFSTPSKKGEYRTDLHPRLSPSKDKICVDCNLKGKRKILIFNIKSC